MRYLKTSEAATLLDVRANTLRRWEARFDFPRAQRSQGNHRMYLHSEVVALRHALHDGLPIASAVPRARNGLSARDRSLVTALGHYDHERADQTIEAALGSRSVENCVEEVLLPALEHIIRRQTADSAAWAFAARWGADWLSRATRLGPPRPPRLSILLGDASRDALDPDAPYIRALELFCMRAGISMMSLSTRGVAGIEDALSVQRPDLVVLAGGGHTADDTRSRWAQSVRFAAGPMPIALYRHDTHIGHMPTAGATVLPAGAGDARQRLLELIDLHRARPAIRTSPDAMHPNVVIPPMAIAR